MTNCGLKKLLKMNRVFLLSPTFSIRTTEPSSESVYDCTYVVLWLRGEPHVAGVRMYSARERGPTSWNS